MDVLEKMRSLRSDADVPTPEQTAAALALLEKAIADEQPRRVSVRRHRRGFAWAGALTAVAVAGAAALVLASVAGIGVVSKPGRHGATIGVVAPPADAEAVLNNAAKLSAKSVPAQPAPGQYVKVQTVFSELVTWQPQPDLAGRASATASWVRHETQVMYVPADRTSTWVWVHNPVPVTITDRHGTNIDTAIKQWQAKNADQDARSVQYLKGGVMPDTVGPGSDIPYGQPAADLTTVPTDPTTFLAWLKTQRRLDNPADNTDFGNEVEVDAIAAYLAENVLPANLRATLFKALALIPGVTLVGTDGTRSTLQYASTQSLTRLTIDNATGLVTNYQSYLNQPQALTQTIGPVPAGIPDIASTDTVTTIDSLPTPLKAGLPQAGNQ